MTPMESIVNSYRARSGLRFDKQVAESLDMTPAALSNYIKGKTRLPHMAIAKISEVAHIDAIEIMAAVNLTYEKTPDEEKRYWQERYKTLMM